MPAAIAAAVATGHVGQDQRLPPNRKHSSTLEGKDPNEGACGPGTAFAAAALASMVVAQADSKETAATAATAAQAVAGSERNTGSLIIHPPPPASVIAAASAPAADQRPSASAPSSSAQDSSAHQKQQQQVELTAAPAAGTAEASTMARWVAASSVTTIVTPTAAAADKCQPSGRSFTPFANPPQPLSIPGSAGDAPRALVNSDSIEPPSYLGPSCLEASPSLVSDSLDDATGPLAAAAMGVAGVAPGGAGASSASGLPGPPSPVLRQRQAQWASGSFTVIREGQPLEDARVPTDLGSRQSSLTSPLSSNSSIQQDGTLVNSPSRPSLSEAGGSEGVAVSSQAGVAMQRQGSTSRLRTPFAIMTQVPPSQPILIPPSRSTPSSSGREGYLWPFGQISSSGGTGGPPLGRRGSGLRSASVDLSGSQLTPVASSGGSGSWHGGSEKAPVVGVRCKMLQTSKYC